MARNRFFASAAILALLSAAPVQAQYIPGGGGATGGGTGTVSNVATGACLTGGPITTTGTVAGTQASRQSNLTTDAILSTDACSIVSYQNAGTKAISIAQATGAFGDGWGAEIANEGAGDLTLTPATSTVNGAATLTIAQNRSCYIYSISGNYKVSACTALVSGGAGSPGGSNTQVQYNNSSSFGGITGATTNGTVMTLTSPVLVTPAIGVATGTTLALNGCTIGANALCTTGAVNFAGILTLGATNTLVFSGRGTLSSIGSNNLNVGGVPSGTPSAQTLGFQNASGTNIAAAATGTIVAPLATGTNTNGDLVFQTGVLTGSGTSGGTPTNAMVIKGETGLVQLPRIATDATHTTSTICQDTTTHALYFGSGTLGICLGTSSARYKHDIALLSMGLSQIMALKPVSYKLNKDKGDPNKTLYGFIAEDMQKVTPQLVGLDKSGRPDTADYVGIVPILVNAVQSISWIIGVLILWNSALTGYVVYLAMRRR